jgi:hypothetical protein
MFSNLKVEGDSIDLSLFERRSYMSLVLTNFHMIKTYVGVE